MKEAQWNKLAVRRKGGCFSVWNYLKELSRLPLGVKQFLYSEPLLGIALGMFAFLLNLHLLQQGVNEIEIGYLTSLNMMVMGLSAIPFGMMADRMNRKVILVTGLFLIGASYFATGIGTTFAHFAIGQILGALGVSMMVSSEIPLLYHYCKSRREETQTYNMMFAIFTLFTGVGTLLGGYLPDWLPKGDSKYESTLYVIGILVCIIGIIRSFLPSPEPAITENTVTANEGVKENRNKGWFQMPSRNVLLFVGFSFFAGGTFGFLIPFLNVIIKFRLNWSDEWVSILLTLNGFILFIASFFTPMLLDRLGLRKSAYILLAGTMITTLLLALQLPWAGFVVLFLLRNGGYMAAVNLLEGQSLQATKNTERGLHSGMRSVARSSASTIAAFIAGYILNLKDYLTPFLLTGVLLVISLLYVHFLMLQRLEEELHETSRTN
jgi:DHA1 family multidrug resistance protein-like MFS transporter